MIKTITVLSLVFLIFSCKWKSEEKTKITANESPVISSIKESSLPCLKCHSYDQYSANKKGRFSHAKHIRISVHCNHCHNIEAHRGSSVKKDICNKCHKLTLFTYTSSGMPVSFSHQGHFKKYSCSDCHPKLFLMKKGASRITMDEIYKGIFCGKCHNGNTAFSSLNCDKCHKMTGFKKELSYQTVGMAPAVFSHKLHTAMFECSSCHLAVFKYKKGSSGMKMDDLYQNKFCGTCHNGQSAFSSSECQKCHK